MIQAVTFDLWDTLVFGPPEYNQHVQKKREELIYNALHKEVSRQKIADALRESWSRIESVRKTLKDVPTAEQLHIFRAVLKVDGDLEKAYTTAVLHSPPLLSPYAEEVLTSLETKIGLISNTGRTPGAVLRPLLSDFGILQFFDCTLFSNEVGYLKPHPAIFQKASRELDVPCSHILHVGDNAATDVEGAHHAGMQALLMRTPSDLLNVLELV